MMYSGEISSHLFISRAYCRRMKSEEKRFLTYYPVPVLLLGVLLPVFIEYLRTGELVSIKNIIEGGWIAIVFMASPYILLAIIGCIIRNRVIMLPPLIGVFAYQIMKYLQISSSSSSTSALGYFYAPLIQLAIIIPVGIFIGFVVRKVQKERSYNYNATH